MSIQDVVRRAIGTFLGPVPQRTYAAPTPAPDPTLRAPHDAKLARRAERERKRREGSR